MTEMVFGPIPTLPTEEIVTFRNFYALCYEGRKKQCRREHIKIADDPTMRRYRAEVEISNRILRERGE